MSPPIEDKSPLISVCIITLNEERNLDRCLSSLPSTRLLDLLVIDSFSSDQTEQVALSRGARFIQNPFENYAQQKNFALEQALCDWVLFLDADEALDAQLKQAVESILGNLANLPERQAFRTRRVLHFMGKRLKHGRSQDFPTRLFEKKHFHFVGTIHERIEPKKPSTPQSKPQTLPGTLVHYSYRDLEDYFVRFNRYTSIIAKNKASKNINKYFIYLQSLRVPIDFVNRYIFRLGFLDAYQGFCYAILSSLYAFVKYAKLYELKHSLSTENETR